MRQSPNGRRPRGRHHGGSNGSAGSGGGNGNGNGSPNVSGAGGNRPRSAASLRHQTFDSNCIEVRVRGNAWQVHEKYQALARDAQSSGDRVAAENFLQHAEHYFRIIEAINEATAAEQRARGVTYPQQQPETPANYYGAPGAAGAPSPSADGNVAATESQPAPTQEAEVIKKSPFFTAEEADDDSTNDGTAPLVAQR